MYRTDYQNHLDTTRHQQGMHRYAQRRQLVRITSGRPQRTWVGVLVSVLSNLFR
jgi:hypothetical protein